MPALPAGRSCRLLNQGEWGSASTQRSLVFGGRREVELGGCDEGGPPRETASVHRSRIQGGLECRSTPDSI
jgi:hypothetical protein